MPTSGAPPPPMHTAYHAHAYRVGAKVVENVTADLPFSVRDRGLVDWRLRTPHRQHVPPALTRAVCHWVDAPRAAAPATRRRAAREVLTAETETVAPPAPPPGGEEGGEGGWVNARALLVTGAAPAPRNGNGGKPQPAEHILRRIEVLLAHHLGGDFSGAAGRGVSAYGGRCRAGGGDAGVVRALAALVREQSGADLSAVPAWHKLVEFRYDDARPPSVWYLPAVWDLPGELRLVPQATEETLQVEEEYDADEVDAEAESALRKKEAAAKDARLADKLARRKKAREQERADEEAKALAGVKRKREEEDDTRKRARAEGRKDTQTKWKDEDEGLTEDEVAEKAVEREKISGAWASEDEAEEAAVAAKRVKDDAEWEERFAAEQAKLDDELAAAELSDPDAPPAAPAPMRTVRKSRAVDRVRKRKTVVPIKWALAGLLERYVPPEDVLLDDPVIFELCAAGDALDEMLKREMGRRLIDALRRKQAQVEADKAADAEVEAQKEARAAERRQLIDAYAAETEKLQQARDEEDVKLEQDRSRRDEEAAAALEKAREAREPEEAKLQQARKAKEEVLRKKWEEEDEGETEDEKAERRPVREKEMAELLTEDDAALSALRERWEAQDKAADDEQLAREEADREADSKRHEEHTSYDAKRKKEHKQAVSALELAMKPRVRGKMEPNADVLDAFEYFDRLPGLKQLAGSLPPLRLENIMLCADESLSLGEISRLLHTSGARADSKGRLDYRKIALEEHRPEPEVKVKEESSSPPQKRQRVEGAPAEGAAGAPGHAAAPEGSGGGATPMEVDGAAPPAAQAVAPGASPSTRAKSAAEAAAATPLPAADADDAV